MGRFQRHHPGAQDGQRDRAIARQFQLSLIATCLSMAMWGQAAIAETKVLRATVNARNGQTFTELMQVAEAAATRLIAQTFARNAAVTQVTVTVLGERNGQETPLLVSSVSRANWQQQPQVRRWTTYFANFSVALLGYRQPVQSQPSPPAVAPAAIAPIPTAPTPTVASPPTAASSPVVPAAPTVVLPPSSPASPTPPRTKDSLRDDPAFRDD